MPYRPLHRSEEKTRKSGHSDPNGMSEEVGRLPRCSPGLICSLCSCPLYPSLHRAFLQLYEELELTARSSPWDLKGRGYTFLHQLAPFSSTPIPLPSSAYDPSETGTSADLSDRFHGGVGALMVVRYSDSPVGTSCLPRDRCESY